LASTLAFQNTSLSYVSRERKGTSLKVLENINFSISSGDFVVIIGRSGSGKTSLLNLAAGFQKPTGGVVSMDGKPVQGPGVERAVVFQDDALYPWLSARDNVAFPLRIKGLGKQERRERADVLLKLVELGHAADRRIWELSGGMRQRVGIARALATEPRFLLLDEPLGALDALTRSRMQHFLLNVWKASGAGALLITHSIDEALLLATRIIVLSPNPGRITASIDTGFAAEILAGRSLSNVKASALFRQQHGELTDLIHQNENEQEFAA
jgi:taurine transport system ATP-binding protein